MFDQAKSKTLEAGLGLLMRAKGYGSVESLELDTEKKSLKVRVLLEGETEPIEAVIEEYKIDTDHDPPQVICQKVRVSRKWMHALAQDRVAGKPVKIPSEVAGLVKMFL